MTTKGMSGLENYVKKNLETRKTKACYVSDVVVSEKGKCKGEDGNPDCAMCRKGKNHAGIIY